MSDGPGRTATAVALVAAAMACIALFDNTVRWLTPELGLWQFQAVRAAICCALLLGVAAAMGLRLRVRRVGAVALRSAVASLAIVLYFGALAVMTINQAGAGLFTAPVFVLVISVSVFGLRVRPLQALAVGLGFAGVLAVLRPWGGAEAAVPLWAAALALGAGALYGLGAVLTHRFCAEEPTAGLTLWHFVALGLWGAAGLGAVTLWAPEAAAGPAGWFARGWVMPSAAAWGWTVANALSAVVAMALIIRAYQIAEASLVAVSEYLFLPLAAVWAVLLFAEAPDLATLAGTALIVLAGALILRRPAVAGPPPLPAVPAAGPEQAVPAPGPEAPEP